MGERIDGIAKVLGTRTSRRVAFAIVAGALLEGAAADRTEAARKGKRGKRKSNNGTCPIDSQCGAACCPAGQYCIDKFTGKCCLENQMC